MTKKYEMQCSFGDPPIIEYAKDLNQDIELVKQRSEIHIGSIVFTPIDYDDIIDGKQYHGVKDAQIDASGLIFLDSIPDTGGTYGKVKKSMLNAEGLVLYDETVDGTSYKKVAATDVSAGHIKLYSGTVKSGEWYNESGVEIDTTHGINIYGADMALTTRATKTGTIQCYVGADGLIYAGAGYVSLGAAGVLVDASGGSSGRYGLKYGATYTGRYITVTSTGALYFYNGSNSLWFGGAFDYQFYPDSAGYTDLGTSSLYFDRVYYKTLYDQGCPVPTFKNSIDIIKGIKTKKRQVTIEGAIKEGFGKTGIEKVKTKKGEIEEIDLTSLPDELLLKPTTKDFEDAERHYQESNRVTRENNGDLSKVEKREPKVGINITDLIWTLVKANQELTERLEKLEAKK